MQRTTGLCASHTQSTSQWIWTVFRCCLHTGPNCMPAKDCYGNLILWAASQCLQDMDWDWESKWFVYILEQTYPDPAEAVVVRRSKQDGTAPIRWYGHWDAFGKLYILFHDLYDYIICFRPLTPSLHDQEVISSTSHWPRWSGMFSRSSLTFSV